MRKTNDVLRLWFENGLKIRAISRSCGIARTTVMEYIRRAQAAQIAWPLPPTMTEAELHAVLFPPRERRTHSPRPDLAHVHRELRRDGVTLQLLWDEYKRDHADGYQYSQFCEFYRQWARTLDVCLRQDYRAGETLFVDYAGQSLWVTDAQSQARTAVHLFVAVLGASNYTYAEATATQQLPDWIHAHVRAFEYFHGVPKITVPDNLKSGVTRACRYDPDLNPTYQALAEHYHTAVVPARPGKPRDKAKAEGGVLIAERWIMAVLRDRVFYGLSELNGAIGELLERLNLRPFKKLPGCRRQRYEELDRPALQPLPAERFEYAEWRNGGVNIDYHVEVQGHYYSVPYTLVGQTLTVRMTTQSVELFHRGKRVAAHARSRLKGRHTTLEAHRPRAHREHLAWPPSRVLAWVHEQAGASCRAVAERIMAERSFPEQGYRACLGLIRLVKGYGPERMKAACQRALSANVCTYRSIRSILEHQIDRQPPLEACAKSGASLVMGRKARERRW